MVAELMGRAVLLLAVLATGLVGCGGPKPVEESATSKSAAQDAASQWTPEMKANYEKFAAQEKKNPDGK